MGFLKPKMPAMPKMEPLPTEDSATIRERVKQALANMRERKGSGSSILAGGTNPNSNPAPATKTLGRARLSA